MHAVSLGSLDTSGLGQHHLGERLAFPAPQGAQPLEGSAIGKARLGEARIGRPDVQRLDAPGLHPGEIQRRRPRSARPSNPRSLSRAASSLPQARLRPGCCTPPRSPPPLPSPRAPPGRGAHPSPAAPAAPPALAPSREERPSTRAPPPPSQAPPRPLQAPPPARLPGGLRAIDGCPAPPPPRRPHGCPPPLPSHPAAGAPSPLLLGPPPLPVPRASTAHAAMDRSAAASTPPSGPNTHRPSAERTRRPTSRPTPPARSHALRGQRGATPRAPDAPPTRSRAPDPAASPSDPPPRISRLPPRAALSPRRRSAPPRARDAPSSPRSLSRARPLPPSRSTPLHGLALGTPPSPQHAGTPPASAPSAASGTRARRSTPWCARPRSENTEAISLTASSAPAITTCSGPFTAAIDTDAACGPTAARTSSSGAAIDTIAPPDGKACISRPRAATSRTASSSVNTPATHAATSSPMLWPATSSGSTPHERHSAQSAYSSVNSAGCVYPVWSSSPASALPSSDHITSRSGRESSPSNSDTHRSNASRNAGHASCSPRPIPATCAPCPVNRNATLPRDADITPARRPRRRLPSLPLLAAPPASASRERRRPPTAGAPSRCASSPG